MPIFDHIDAPDYWAPYLINGDATGLSDEDREDADQYFNGYYVVDVSEDSWFSWNGRANGSRFSGCTLATYTVEVLADTTNNNPARQ